MSTSDGDPPGGDPMRGVWFAFLAAVPLWLSLIAVVIHR